MIGCNTQPAASMLARRTLYSSSVKGRLNERYSELLSRRFSGRRIDVGSVLYISGVLSTVRDAGEILNELSQLRLDGVDLLSE